MADQQSSHASLTNVVGTWYSKKILKDFEPQTQFYSLAPVKVDIPKYEGKTVNFDRFQKIDALYSDDTDEFTAQQMYLSASVVTATLHERDGYVQLSRYASLTARGNILDRAAEKVSDAARKTIDKLIRNDVGMCVADVAAASSVNMNNLAIDGGTLNSSGVTARVWSHDAAAAGDRFPMYHNKTRVAQSAQVVSFASSGMTIKTLQHGVSVLEGKDVPTMADGNYKMITHPDVAYQMTTNAGFKGWFSPTSSEAAKKSPSMVGVVAGVSIHKSTLAYKFPLSGDTLSTSSGNLYCSLLFGDEAYGATEISGANGGRKGFQFFLKQSGPQTTSDPTNKKKQAGFSVTAAGKVLNKSAGLWILTTGL
jgi:N4-gp56 family major capsid protein